MQNSAKNQDLNISPEFEEEDNLEGDQNMPELGDEKPDEDDEAIEIKPVKKRKINPKLEKQAAAQRKVDNLLNNDAQKVSKAGSKKTTFSGLSAKKQPTTGGKRYSTVSQIEAWLDNFEKD